MTASRYRGRFAPSPTGPLHFGSLVAAVGSFADARHHNGTWLVRMEDLDQPRCVPGADRVILATLHAFGMSWDGEPVYQQRRGTLYAAALARLRGAGVTYPCACSRREIAARAQRGVDGPIYPGTCRSGLAPGRIARSERVQVEAGPIRISDRVQGTLVQDLAGEVGDFVLRRADGLHAYQLAVVVDDAAQGINQIVRGADLLDSTPRQHYLQRLLELPTPSYAHLPLALDIDGRKLSKSTAALPVDANHPLPALQLAWRFLGQAPLPEPCRHEVERFWRQAIPRWNIARVPRQRSSVPL
jgi:glutamyl-Q tRNA(Asp) synthetase